MTETGSTVPNRPQRSRFRPRATLLGIVHGRAETAMCTIYPPDVAAPARSERTLTATGDAFVRLETTR
jgi:hypothetical protein